MRKKKTLIPLLVSGISLFNINNLNAAGPLSDIEGYAQFSFEGGLTSLNESTAYKISNRLSLNLGKLEDYRKISAQGTLIQNFNFDGLDTGEGRVANLGVSYRGEFGGLNGFGLIKDDNEMNYYVLGGELFASNHKYFGNLYQSTQRDIEGMDFGLEAELLSQNNFALKGEYRWYQFEEDRVDSTGSRFGLRGIYDFEGSGLSLVVSGNYAPDATFFDEKNGKISLVFGHSEAKEPFGHYGSRDSFFNGIYLNK